MKAKKRGEPFGSPRMLSFPGMTRSSVRAPVFTSEVDATLLCCGLHNPCEPETQLYNLFGNITREHCSQSGYLRLRPANVPAASPRTMPRELPRATLSTTWLKEILRPTPTQSQLTRASFLVSMSWSVVALSLTSVSQK